MNYKNRGLYSSRKRIGNILVLLLLLLLGTGDVFAQVTGAEILISVTIPPPYTPEISVWRSDPSRILISLVNTTSRSYRVRLSGYAENGDGSVRLETKDEYPVTAINIGPMATLMLTGRDLSLTDVNAVRYRGTSSTSIARTGRLPEGSYSLCLHVLNYEGAHDRLSSERCGMFTIAYMDPPRLLTPSCDADITTTSPQSINFSWVMPSSSGAALNYKFTLIELAGTQNVNDAFRSGAPRIIVDRTISMSNIFYGPSDPALRSGTRYGWRVQAIDPSGRAVMRNNGYSEACTFRFGTEVSSPCNSPTIRVAYPPTGSRIPYRQTPVFVKFEPYCDSYRHFHSRLEFHSGTTHTTDLNWTTSPRFDEGASSGLTQEQAQYVAMSDGSPLVPGRELQWNAHITMQNAGHDIIREAEGHFSVGMGPSIPLLPANDTTLAPGLIRLQWRAAEAPAAGALVPPAEIIRCTRPGHLLNRAAVPMSVAERWMLEVSRSENLSGLVHFQYGVVGEHIDPRTQSESQITESLYGTITDNHRYTDSGDYYWRIKWLVRNDPSANDTSAYAYSPTFHFVINAPRYAQTECIEINPFSPSDGAEITSDQTAFVVRINPTIDTSAITGGRLQIWRMERRNEDHVGVMERAAVYDQRFAGADAAAFQKSTTEDGIFDLAFASGARAAHPFRGVLNTSYLWRFTLDFEPNRIRHDSHHCEASSVRSSDAVFTYAPAHESEGGEACADDCSAPLPSDMLAVPTEFHERDTLHFGKFLLHLTEVHGNGLSLSGRGWIQIHFLLNRHFAVAFSGVTVNRNGEVTGGSAHVIWGGDTPLPDLSSRGSSIGLTQEQIRDLQGIAGQQTRLLKQAIMNSPITLPIGIDTLVGGQRLVIGILSMDFTPRNAHLAAAMSIPMSMLGPDIGIGLGARDICFSPNGLMGDGRATLYLPSDIGYRDNVENNWGFVFKGQTMRESSIIDSGTYVTWNCHGFEKLRLSSEVVFPRTWLVPIDAAGQVVAHEKVRAGFTVMIERSYINATHSNWGWMATGTMNSRFAVPDAPDFIFDVNTIAIDQSDNENAPGMTFPDGYRGETGEAWRGFYINTLMMSLPNQFRTMGTGRPIQFAMNNLLIDHSGFSASLRANNIVEVNYGGWRGEIDTIGINFVSSSLTEGFLDGRILTPLSSTNWLHYRAAICHRSGGVGFVFNVNLTESIQTDLWAARLTLDPTTRIELRAGAGEGFVALLLMSGSLSVNGDLHAPSGSTGGSMPAMNLNSIRFQNIALSTQRPYLGCADRNGVIQESRSGCIEMPVFGSSGSGSSESSSSGGGSSAGGFSFSINDISIHADFADMEHLKFGLGMNVTIHLQSGANGAGGGTTMTLWTRLDHPTTAPEMSFDGMSLNGINLDVEVGSTVRIAGRVDFYGENDPIYGNGFRGHVRASFVEKVTVDATVQFGSKMRSPSDADPYRYWYVDAMVYLPTGIPFMTGLAFYGFGGGAWYNMDFDRTIREPAPPTTPTASNTAAVVPPGYTASGYRFIPSPPRGTDNAFGFRAKVAIGTYGSDQVFNADITMSVQFIRGGIASILLEGDGFLLAGIHNRDNAIATAHVMTEYRFVEQTLDMNMSVQLSSPYNTFVQLLSADHAIMFHADPHRWFFRAGTPADPSGLRVAGFLNVQTYLMAGTDILPPGPLPTEISSRLGALPIVRTAEMRTGDGFALGGLIDLRTPRIEVFPVWGQFQAMVGFDFGLIHYQPPTTCIGSRTPVGSNGWYGSGRLFAYFSGSVGFFNPFRDTSDPLRYWALAEISIPSVIQGGTPNPTWASGALSGSFSYRDPFGRLQHSAFHTQFRIGEECHPTPQPRENPMAGLELISELSPADGSRNISSAVRPRASLDYNIDQQFAINETSDDGSSRLRTFRVKIRNFTIARYDGASERAVSGSYAVSDDHTHVILTPTAPLDGGATYTHKVSAYAEELSGGVWSLAHSRSGRAIEDTVAAIFVTAPPLDTITANDVAYSYPLDRQRYFLQGEYRTGTVALLTPNPQLLSSTMHRPGTQVSYIARFMHSLGGGVIETPATYNTRLARIEFQIPPLDHRTVYSLQIIRHEISPLGTPEPTNDTRQSGRSSKSGSTGKSGISRGRFGIGMRGDSLGRGEKLLYRYYFRTSQFDRLQEKIAALTPLPSVHPNPFGHWELLHANYQSAEPLDVYDMNGYTSASGTQVLPPLIRLNANARTSVWHTSYTNPWIYSPIDRLRRMHLWSGRTEFEQNVDNYNQFPMMHPSSVLAVYISTPEPPLSDQDLRRSSPGNSTGPPLRIDYMHGGVIPNDQTRLRNTAASIISAHGSDTFTSEENTFLRSVLTRRYELFYHGDYPLTFIYGYGIATGKDSAPSATHVIRY